MYIPAFVNGGIVLTGPAERGEDGRMLVLSGAGLAWADPSAAASSLVAAHESADDPHPQYTSSAEAAAAAPVQSVAGRTGAVVLSTSDVTGLDTALSGKADLIGGVVPSSQLPALVVTDVYTVADEAAMVALAAEQGDLAIRSDGAGTFVHNGGTAGSSADWTLLNVPTAPVTSVNGLIGSVTLGYADVGALPVSATTSDITGLDSALAGKLANASNLSDLGSARTACGNLHTWHALAWSAAGTATLTGTTDETALVSVQIPAGAMGPNGVLRVTLTLSYTSSGNQKTFRLRFGAANDLSGTAFLFRGETTLRLFSDTRSIMNRGSASSQIGSTGQSNGAYGSFNVANVTSAVNTANTSYLVISGQLANSSEQIVVESYLVEVLYGA